MQGMQKTENHEGSRMITLTAYHGSNKIKSKYVKRMKDHITNDELVHGVGFENGKGCAVGCTLNRYDHKCYQNELGLPEWLALLEDKLFEGMSLEKSKTFPLELLKAIPVGADLTKTFHKMNIFILELAKQNVTHEFDYVISAIDDVIDYHLKMASGFFQTESAAESAAWSAAWAARSAESAARSAAWSAWSAAHDKMADKLIELLKEAEIQ